METTPLTLFLCDRRNLTLSKAGCARLYASANNGKPPDPFEGRAACRACPIGALHLTGVLPDPTAQLTEALRRICPRCGRPAERLIWGILCASCDARHREALKGRNAKGHPPALSKVLHPASIVMADKGGARIVCRSSVVGLGEIILHAAKSTKTPVAFSRRRLHWPALTRKGRIWAPQMELGL
jgi:hypothetical protein